MKVMVVDDEEDVQFLFEQQFRYDIIVQEHKGEIKVETEEVRFTELIIGFRRG